MAGFIYQVLQSWLRYYVEVIVIIYKPNIRPSPTPISQGII